MNVLLTHDIYFFQVVPDQDVAGTLPVFQITETRVGYGTLALAEMFLTHDDIEGGNRHAMERGCQP